MSFPKGARDGNETVVTLEDSPFLDSILNSKMAFN